MVTTCCVKMIQTIVKKVITTRNTNPESAQFHYGAPKRDIKDAQKSKVVISKKKFQ